MKEDVSIVEKVKDNDDGMIPVYGMIFLGFLVTIAPFVLDALNIH